MPKVGVGLDPPENRDLKPLGQLGVGLLDFRLMRKQPMFCETNRAQFVAARFHEFEILLGATLESDERRVWTCRSAIMNRAMARRRTCRAPEYGLRSRQSA